MVEVASARTRLYDRNRKKDIYQGFGIPAYWIVEPSRDHPELTVFDLRSGGPAGDRGWRIPGACTADPFGKKPGHLPVPLGRAVR